jgi:transposase
LNYRANLLVWEAERKGITLYHHDKRRSGLVVEEFLGDYTGYVHCDMWSAYRQLDKAQLVGCWASDESSFPTSLGAKGLAYCDRLFTLENDWADLSTEERLHKRQTELAPLMDEFFGWCRNQLFKQLPNLFGNKDVE